MKNIFKNIENIEILIERDDLFSEMISSGTFDLEDSRRMNGGNFQYPLQEILLAWLIGWIYGSHTYGEIAFDAETKLSLMKRFFPYENGAPGRSTIARTVGIIDPNSLENLLKETVINIQKRIAKNKDNEDRLQTIAIDGKTNCGARKTTTNSNPLHIVGAFDTKLGIILTQTVVPEKANEIIAIKSILKKIYIKDYTVTIDAMGTQKEITKLIRKRGANYILAVKGNQKMVHIALMAFFEKPKNQERCEQFMTSFKGHGRNEKYECYVMGDVLNELPWLANRGWTDLKSMIKIVHFQTSKGGLTTSSERYFITNLTPDATKIFHAIRSHWGIESMHWTLDVTFDEDNRIVWNRTIAQNESIIRRIAFNLLTVLRAALKKPTRKDFPTYHEVQKRLYLDDDMLESLLLSAFK